jgi:tRNA (guanine-N7-)-methyltransferase
LGRKNKLLKFSEILRFKNVVENYDYLDPKLTHGVNEVVDFKDKWSKDFFHNANPITLELACGRGEYTNALGKSYPNRNFIGIDVKGARIWKGAKAAIDLNLDNVGFLRTRIEQVHLFFGKNEIDEIWITFPDPFLLKERNRLTHHRFLELYAPFLKDGGFINLKTDDETLYDFSIDSFQSWNKGEIIYSSNDIYNGDLYSNDLLHNTYYENKHLAINKKIKYIKFQYRAV